MHPPPSPARTDFTLITECTPESSGCYSVYSVVGTSVGATRVAASRAGITAVVTRMAAGRGTAAGATQTTPYSQGRNKGGRNLSSGGWGHSRGSRRHDQGGQAAAGAAGVATWAGEVHDAGELKLGPVPAGWRGGGWRCGLPIGQQRERGGWGGLTLCI